MDTSFYKPLGASELLPRYVCLQPLIDAARVLEIGAVAATGGSSAAFLRESGARWVLAVDSNQELIERAQREYSSDPDLRFRATAPDSIEAGSVDVVLVADGAPYFAEPAELDKLVRVAQDGWLVLALRNPAGVSLAQFGAAESAAAPVTYGRMIALLKDRFPSVEVLTQSSLFGYQLAPTWAGDELELSIDGTLAGAVDAAYFLAVCGRRPSGLPAEQSIVALPGAPLAVAAGGRGELTERLDLSDRSAKEARKAVERLRSERAELELRIVALSDEVQQQKELSDQERRRARGAEERADAAEAEGRKQRERVSALEAALAQLRPELDALRAARAKFESQSLEQDLSSVRERAGRFEARVAALQSERGALFAQVEESNRRARDLEASFAELQSSESEARGALSAEAERARIAAAEAMAAAARVSELAEALATATARAERLERDVAAATTLERALRERADRAEESLAAQGRSAAEPPADYREAAEKRIRDAEAAWEQAERSLEEATTKIADLEEEAQVLENSLSEAERIAEERARLLADLQASAAHSPE